MQAQRFRTFSRPWSLGGVIHITKSLLQAQLVLENAAASHYFTYIQEMYKNLSKPPLQKHYFGGIHLTIVHHIYSPK